MEGQRDRDRDRERERERDSRYDEFQSSFAGEKNKEINNIY